MIVFGHNNFKIKSTNSHELGLPSDAGFDGYQFEVRQRYAHLFWIPFFPIGKIYVMKIPGSSEMYEMPESIRALVEAKLGKVRTPWYSFALLLIALAVGFVAICGVAVEEIKQKARVSDREEKIRLMIEYPTSGDYYSMDWYEDENGYRDIRVVLKVQKYDENTVTIISMNEDLYQKCSSYDFYTDFDMVEGNNYNITTIDKSALKEAVSTGYSTGDSRKKLGDLDGFFVLNRLQRRELDSYAE